MHNNIIQCQCSSTIMFFIISSLKRQHSALGIAPIPQRCNNFFTSYAFSTKEQGQFHIYKNDESMNILNTVQYSPVTKHWYHWPQKTEKMCFKVTVTNHSVSYTSSCPQLQIYATSLCQTRSSFFPNAKSSNNRFRS